MEVVIPEVTQPVFIPPTGKLTRTEIREALELLINFPNQLPLIYWYLKKLGVKFPHTTEVITNVTVDGGVISLPKPIKLDFTINVNGKTFHLPRDAKRLAVYVGSHPHILTAMVTILHQLGGRFTVDRGGKIISFEIFGRALKFPNPMGVTVLVRGKSYYLPRDIKVLLRMVKNDPAVLLKIKSVLEAYGVRFIDTPGRNMVRAIYDKDSYDIPVSTSVRITVGKKSYNIPADLDALFRSKEGLQVGEILQGLQRAKVPLKVERDTGIITGIVVGGVTVPLPFTLDLRFKLYGRQYVIPRDLGKIVAVLEKANMPSLVLSILYNRYGVVPIRNADNAVTALSFGDQKFPVKMRPQTVLVIAGVKLWLPRDAAKLTDLLKSKKVTVVQLLQALQLVGYTFVPGPGGVLRTIQKGAERIKLDFEIRMYVLYDGKKFRIPKDLPLLVDVFSKLKPDELTDVMASLTKYGAVIAIKRKKVVILFNGLKYETKLKSHSGVKSGLVVHMGSKTFNIPKDLDAIVSKANSKGAAAVQLLVELFKAFGVKVNQSPKGLIISIVIDGRRYSTSGRGGQAESNVKVKVRGKVFWIPRDMPSLPKKLPKFHYGELLDALIRMGAKVEADSNSNFYGFRYKNQLRHFPEKFRVSVKVDKTGAQFRVPADLDKLAKTLAKGKWVWDDVRKTLRAAGIKVSKGRKAISSFSFQGKVYKVK